MAVQTPRRPTAASRRKSAHDQAGLVRRLFIEAAGNATQSAGFGRIIGQIYAHAYFSPEPQSLDDLTAALGISKGSASMAVRQLAGWGGLRRVWVKGDRKDYYETTEEFGRIVRQAVSERVGRALEEAAGLVDGATRLLNGGGTNKETAFLRDRVDKIRAFQARAKGLWDSPVVRLILR